MFDVVHVIRPFFKIGREEVSGDDVGAWEERPYLKGTSGAGLVPGPPEIFDSIDVIGRPDADFHRFGQFPLRRGGYTGNTTVGERSV